MIMTRLAAEPHRQADNMAGVPSFRVSAVGCRHWQPGAPDAKLAGRGNVPGRGR